MRLLPVLLAAFLFCSCGHAAGAQPAQQLSLAPPIAMLAKLRRQGSAYSTTDRMRLGAQFEPGLPHLNVATQGDAVKLTPFADASGLQMGGLAYATYAFQLPANLEEPLIRVDWDAPSGNSPEWYVALADWSNNTWYWVKGNSIGGAVFGSNPAAMARFRDADGSTLAVIAFRGNESYSLSRVMLGAAEWQHEWSWDVGDAQGSWIPSAMAQAADGFVVLSSGGPNDGQAAHLNYSLIKYGLDGRLMWHRFYSAADLKFGPAALTVTQAGDIIAIQTYAGSGAGPIFYRFDSQGSYIDGKEFAGDELWDAFTFDICRGLCQDSSGNLFMTVRGTDYSSGSEQRLSFMFGFDSQLTPIFSRTSTLTGLELLSIDTIGQHLFLCGSQTVGTEWPDFHTTATFMALDKTGHQELGKHWAADTDTSDTRLIGMEPDSEGNLYTAGAVDSSLADEDSFSYGLLLKWSPDGSLLDADEYDRHSTHIGGIGEVKFLNGALYGLGASQDDSFASELYKLRSDGALLSCTELRRLANSQAGYGTVNPMLTDSGGDLILLGWTGDFSSEERTGISVDHSTPTGEVTDLPDAWIDYGLTYVGPPMEPQEVTLQPIEDQLPAAGQATMIMQFHP